MTDTVVLRQRMAAEFLGTGFLVAAVVGSGIMAARLFAGNVGLTLLANTVATGAALVALIVTYAPISGAHFNPAVTLAIAGRGGLPLRDTVFYVAAQIAGGLAGVICAHAMFGLPLAAFSQHQRSGGAQMLSEAVATFGLLSVIWSCARTRTDAVGFAVAAYISAAYWFTASTSFANPAVTIARAFSDTFAGIRPADVPGFIAGQAIGATLSTVVFAWLLAPTQAAGVTPRPEVHDHV